MRKLALISFIFALAAGTWVFIYAPTKEQRCDPATPLNYSAIVEHGPRSVQKVALTFDDWGSREDFETIIRILREKNVKAAFFVVGKGIRAHPDLLRMLVDEGHLIGNHTYSHVPLATFDAKRVRDELRWTRNQLAKQGVEDKPYFRYPFSSRNDATDAIVWSMGYTIFFWDVNSGGTGFAADYVRYRVVNWSKPGSIVLMHISSQADIEALPKIIDGLRARGLEPVRLDKLFASC